MEKMSIVVPCYNEEEAISIFYEVLKKEAEALPDVELEIIYVNDGSRDHSLAEMKRLAEQDERVHYVGLSRNFGKEAAMYAGLAHSTGDYVAIMDVDLQDPPALLPDMLRSIREDGYDCVATRRVSRKGEPPIRSFFARQFYRIMHKISKTEIVDGARDYRLMTGQFVDEFLKLGEYNRFSKGLFGWMGFRTKWLEYENIERVAGETKWSFWKLVHGSAGIFGIPGDLLLYPGIHSHLLYCDPYTGPWRPGGGLAVHDLHHCVHRRRSAVLHGNPGRVSGKDLSGDQKAPYFHLQRDRYEEGVQE